MRRKHLNSNPPKKKKTKLTETEKKDRKEIRDAARNEKRKKT